MIAGIFELIGSLGLFLYGMRVMSDGLQKVAGDGLHTVMNFMTRNRVMAVLTGFMVTAILQSSSATTVMVVSFVNASLLNLFQAIGVIMGANIGTTVTTWVVSLVGFKLKISALAVPIIGIGFPFALSKKAGRRDFGQLLVGFGLLFLGLAFLKESVPDIHNHPEVLEFLKDYASNGFWSFVLFVGVGSILTVVVQSSSAAMAVTVTMAYKGWIDFPTAAAIVLGENIGTTITAYLASLGTSVNARRAARAHFMFNFLGVLWMTLLFNTFIKFVLKLAPWDSSLQSNLPLNLSLFHTVFNLINTLMFLPFVGYFARLVQLLVKPGAKEPGNQYRLRYVSSTLQDALEVNLYTAVNEIKRMASVTGEMVDIFVEVFFSPHKKMGDKVEKVKQLENLTDEMQEEISRFLVRCLQDDVSDRVAVNINAMLRIVHELENVADSCFRLILLTEKKYLRKLTLHPTADEEIKAFAHQVQVFIAFYKEHLVNHLQETDLQVALDMEKHIDQARYRLKKGSRQRISAGADVSNEFLYLDLLRHLEHIGDYALNITEALRKVR